MNAILRRRSIRKYTGQEVAMEDIRKLLEAAMCAPSAGNERPWEFIVIRDKSKLHELAGVSAYSGMLENASTAILVCGNMKRTRFGDFWIQDCSAATENILVMAEELKLGAVWLGVYPEPSRVDFIREAVAMPDTVIPFSLIPVGYPAEEPERIERNDENRIHLEKW